MKSRNFFKRPTKTPSLLKTANYTNMYPSYAPASKKQLVISKNEIFVCSPLRSPVNSSTLYSSSASRRKTLSDFLLPNNKTQRVFCPLSPQNLMNCFSEENIIEEKNPFYSPKRMMNFSSRNCLEQSNDVYSPYGSQKLTRSNSNVSGGVVDFFDLPIKKHKRSYSVNDSERRKRLEENKKYMKNVVLIQSFVRMFLLRKKLYDYIKTVYKLEAAAIHLDNYMRNIREYYLKFAMYLISKHIKGKYFVSKREYKLLMDLKRRKINSKEQLDKFFVWLAKEEY